MSTATTGQETGLLRADVIVVGGGGSALAAAISAAESGAKVLLLEKNPELGGTTRLSIGSITATRTALQKRAGIEDSPDEHFEDMAKFAGDLLPKDNVELRRVLVDNVSDTVAWLTSLGVTFFGPMPEPPHRKPRMHNILPNSRAYIYYLKKEARRVGVEIKLNAAVSDLVIEQGRVTGVKVKIGDRDTIARAGAVVMASGDTSASRELKLEARPELSETDGINPTNTGDGQIMGRRAGGYVRNLEVMFAQLRFVAPPTTSFMFRLPPWKALTTLMQAGMRLAPAWLLRPFILSFVTTFLAPEPAMFREGAILVNRRGERFTDEIEQPAQNVPSQPDKMAFIVIDRKLADTFSQWPNFVSTAPGVAYAYVKDYKSTRPDVYHEGGTIAELARKMGVPAAALEATIRRYNEEGRNEKGRARPALDQAPFIALGPVCNWVVLTDGGLAVTTGHEVVKPDGQVIPGLYAAGSAGQGGLLLEGHGHHLGWAFTSGRRAGRNAASHARQHPA
ncbi:MAG: FAD-dependent oxidoreductase [Xanthobacteraceae bacterium]|nr:FAD-dependent oxidoreductase [Xanthobacteraceae bacterium]